MFSALHRILTPYRQSMLHQRLASFEKELTAQLTRAVLIERFKRRPRRLQIWKRELCSQNLRLESLIQTLIQVWYTCNALCYSLNTIHFCVRREFMIEIQVNKVKLDIDVDKDKSNGQTFKANLCFVVKRLASRYMLIWKGMVRGGQGVKGGSMTWALHLGAQNSA